MDMMKEQARIEQDMADRGFARYQRLSREAAEAGQATRSRSVQTVLDSAIVSVSGALREFLEKANTGRAGRRHTAAKLLEGIDPDLAAYMTVRVVLDNMAQSVALTATAVRIARALELELAVERLRRDHPAYMAATLKDLDSRTHNERHRRAVFNRVRREFGEDEKKWTEAECVHVGVKMVELLIESTGLVEVTTDSLASSRRRLSAIRATDRFRDWLHSLDTRFGLMSPEYLPCVVPPKDWTDFWTGGYLTDALAYPPTLVKTSNKDHISLIEEATSNGSMSAVYEAVNAIQRTPWAINTRVLEVVEDLIEGRHAVAGLPPMDEEPLPAKPVDIDTNEEALRQWKREAARTYEENRRMTGRRINALRAVHTAKDFAHYPAIYFPHQLDFRGRIYPIPPGLNPQGNDLVKGLLHFAEGGALDSSSAVHWFEVHGANAYGIDKVSFEARRKWVADNAEHIYRSADDPLGYQWWADADSPFVFLAWAMEFRDWADSGCSPKFVSRVPVAMDGSCNGIQHYSAMLRDPRGGFATNLVPSDEPKDIYQEVADEVMRRLQAIVDAAEQGDNPPTEEAVEDARLAHLWGSYGIDRSITKRPVMVLPYGGTQRSCFDYTYDAVKARGGYPFETEHELHRATVWLGKVIWESIGEVVIGARLAMDWIRGVARTATKEGRALHWTTPAGFPVVQSYPKVASYRVETSIHGVRFQPKIWEGTVEEGSKGRLDAHRQANGAAPNFVHSMDAAALVLTVRSATYRGIKALAMVHDSYGTLAREAGVLAETLRHEFVRMYDEHDVLEEFAEAALGGQSETPSPFVGGLRLEDVVMSRYFFA